MESPEQITARFHQLGVLLLLDAPEKLEFGIDNITWKVGSKFKGLKLIPLGTHIITYSLKDENYMFPMKKFIHFGGSNKDIRDDERIWVYRWNEIAQRFLLLKGDEAEGYREGVKKYHFDCYLGAYPTENLEFWSSNTKYITKKVLDKLDPIESYSDYSEEYASKKINKIEEEQLNLDEDSDGEHEITEEIEREMEFMEADQKEETTKPPKKGEKPENEQNIKKSTDFGGNIYYSEIPRRLTGESHHTSIINIDRTEILESILQSEWPDNEFGLLGELQYSFICFLIGQCLDSYTQWKQLMILFSSSEKAFCSHKELMLEFLIVFYEQIKQFPQDFFIDEIGKDVFLKTCLKNFRTYQSERTLSKKCLSRIEKLLAFISEMFTYEQDSDEEENPIVVEESESYF